MTKDEAKKNAAVLLAFAEGKEIQFRHKNDGGWVVAKAVIEAYKKYKQENQ